MKPDAALVVVEKSAKPRDEMFDAVAEVAGADPRAHGSRIAKLARLIEAKGITPAEFRERLPAVVAQYAPFRSACDLATIDACWSWIRTPPLANGPPANGKKLFMPRGEAELNHAVDVVTNTLAKRGML